MSTPYMGLDLPVPGVDAGPGWAEKLNASLISVDAHNHSAGSGAPVSINDISGAGTMARQSASAVSITGGTVTGLGTPSNPSDAATKSYVDASHGAGSASAVVLGCDPTGTTAIGNLLYSITAAMRVAGQTELVFPPGFYKLNGSEQIAPSLTPLQPFTLTGLPGATFIPAATSAGLNFGAWGTGDTMAPGQFATTINCNSGSCVSFIMTVIGGETVLTGFSSTASISVGNTILLYIGAEVTDASGWCNSWIFATVKAKTGTTVTIDRPLPSPCPTPDNNVGINVIRTHQTHHTLRVITGFMDFLTIRGFQLNNVFLAPIFARYGKIDCFWPSTYFGVQATGTVGLEIDFAADTVTGYDTGGGGAFSHYGEGIILNSCYATDIKRYVCENQDGVGAISEELSCRGTRVGLLSANTNSALSPTGSIQLVGATSGSTDILSIDHVLLRGGNGSVSFIPTARVGRFESRASHDNQSVFIRADQCESICWRDQNFREVRQFDMVIPLVASVTTTRTVPQNGLVRRMWLYFTSIAGITAVHIDGTAAGTDYDITPFITAANTWIDINPAGLLAAACPNFLGYCTPRIKITGNGSVVAGNACIVDVDMMLADVNALGQPIMNDTTPPRILVGSGAPGANAVYLGQMYFDTVGKVWYTAKNIGTGATDWS